MVFPSTDLDIIVEVYMGANPTDDPADWPAPVDLSSRLLRKPIQIRRGRGINQKTAQAGACTLWLDNTDGALTPLLPTSFYFEEWDLGVPLRVSVDNVGPNPPYVRHAGFVAEIEAVMVPGVGGVNISAVRVTSAGVLRRISQGAVEKSGLRRLIEANDPHSYWALDDGPLSLSGRLTAGVGGDFTASLWNGGGVNAGSAEVASWLGTGLELDGFDEIVLAEATYNIALTPASRLVLDATVLVNLGSTGSGVTTFGILDQHTNSSLTATQTHCFAIQIQQDAIGTGTATESLLGCFGTLGSPSIIVGTAGSFAFDETVPHHLRIDVAQNGGNLDLIGYIDGVSFGSGTMVGYSLGTFGARVVRLTHYGVGTDVGSTVIYTDVAVWVDNEPPSIATAADAALGFAGEQAHNRIERNCLEEGIPFSTTATLSNECGPQPIGGIVDVLRDAETVDHGLLAEDLAFGLSYRASSQRENLSPVITVDLSTYRTTSGTQADVLTPIRNDARLRNKWTISRTGGSSATASDTDHIAIHGSYPDSADVNVDGEGRLLDEAQWRVHEGTFDGLRYQTIPLDIAANQ